ncbi:hypothetical protein PFISCL1PPCAC_24908, partial [Pristionchus fissidentatus]
KVATLYTSLGTARRAFYNRRRDTNKSREEKEGNYKMNDDPKREEVDKRKKAAFCFGHTRHLMLLISVMAVSAAKSNDFTFTFTVICMTSNSSQIPIRLSNHDRDLLFAAAGVGALMSAVVIAFALHRVGARTVFPATLLISGSATLVMPFIASSGVLAILPIRLMQGAAVAAVMPMIGYISSHWAPLSEMGNFVTMLTAGIQISQIITMPLSGELCVSAGWQWSYYVHGLSSLSVALAFFCIFRNSPESHRFVSSHELALINNNATRNHDVKRAAVPYRFIFSDPAVWAIWVAFLGNAFGYQMILQFMPTFLNKVMGIAIERTGFFAILPPIAQLCLKVVGGIVNDNLTCIKERTKLRLFNTLGMVGCGFFLLPLGFLQPGSSLLPIAFFTASVASMGLITCGSIKSVTLISRQYSHFVMAIVQFVVCIGYLLVPLFVSTVAPNNSIYEWRLVFFGVFINLLITNGIFCYWCQSE